ncbi:MAG: hypothetical protein P8174_09550 [Gemmatimonadota bacterium]|jgi:HPt (histidine-containing phosphotransfer) domain-containing protein
MSRLLTFFRHEAAEQIASMRACMLDGDAEELYRHARVLRGSAQMAQQEVVRQLAATVEAMAGQLARGEITWDDTVRTELNSATAELERQVGDAEEHVTRMQAEDEVGEQDIVPISEFLYSGDRAFDRVRELRAALEQHIHDPEGLELLAELYELIELGRT